MTGVALRICLYVGYRLARRYAAVMTGRAAPHCRGVVHYGFCRLPTTGRVACIATRRSRHVRDRLAGRLQGIMAARALPEHVGGVLHHRTGKRVLVMAVQALLRWRNWYMRRRPKGQSPSAALDMASVAVLRQSASGYTGAVATGTLQIRVRALQYKARRIVAEAGGRLRRRRHRKDQRKQGQRGHRQRLAVKS